jgi:NitT/TauT family transport system substrate-binding protein
VNPTRNSGSAWRLASALALAAIAAMAGSRAAAADPATGPTDPARRLDAVTLRVDWLFQGYHGPFFLGVAKGWYRQAGIDVSIKEGRGSGNVVQLVGNNSDTFGFAGADAVLRGVQNGIPVLSVANIVPKNADTMFVLRKSGITRPQDLRGKTIATTPGGTSDALLPAFLATVGLAAGDVTIVPVDASLKSQLVLQGRVDAAALPSWVEGMFDVAGGAVGFPFARHGVQVVGYGIVTNADAVRNHPDLVARFVAVTLRAWEYARQHPDEAIAAVEAASAEQREPRRAARNRVETPALFALVGPAVPGKPFGTQSETDWQAMQKQLVDYGVVKESLPVERYLTNRFVR